MEIDKLQAMAAKLVAPGKGILAADQSPRTMNRQLAAIGVPEEAEMRRQYRQLLFTTEGIEQYITGVILHDGTIRNQTDDGTPFVDLLVGRGIIPIIKVDKSTVPLDGFPGEVVTEGLDGLADRLAEYTALARGLQSGARSLRSLTGCRPRSASNSMQSCWRGMPALRKRSVLCRSLSLR